MQRGFEDLAQRRIDQTGGKVMVRYLFCDSFGRDDEHLFGHALGFCRKDRHANGREDIDIVALAWHEGLAFELHWGKRAAAGKDGATTGPPIGLFGRALRTRGRVRIWEDERPLIDL